MRRDMRTSANQGGKGTTLEVPTWARRFPLLGCFCGTVGLFCDSPLRPCAHDPRAAHRPDVDDEAPLRRVLERSLSRDGYRVVSAGAGDGYELLATPADALLLDITPRCRAGALPRDHPCWPRSRMRRHHDGRRGADDVAPVSAPLPVIVSRQPQGSLRLARGRYRVPRATREQEEPRRDGKRNRDDAAPRPADNLRESHARA